jgi:hypothetical protein
VPEYAQRFAELAAASDEAPGADFAAQRPSSVSTMLRYFASGITRANLFERILDYIHLPQH